MDWRQEDAEEGLRRAYQEQRDGIVRTRLHARWLLRRGKRMGEVPDIVGTHRRTVQDWVGWYRGGGIEEVAVHKKDGKGVSRFLNPDQERALTDEVSSGRFQTAGEIRDWIESEYGVSYRSGSIYRVLERLRCASRVPRLCHVNAEAARHRQKAWEKEGSVAEPCRRPA